jgi:hypothetical protein
MPASQKDKESALIEAVKALLKEHKIVKQMFDDFGVDIDSIDNIPIEFSKLRASAKTKDGHIFLNEKLLEDGDFSDDVGYIVHELCHCLQQQSGHAKYDKDPESDYLDLPAEVEAFRHQIKFMNDFYGSEEAKNYLNELLDFHEFDGSRREAKEQELKG